MTTISRRTTLAAGAALTAPAAFAAAETVPAGAEALRDVRLFDFGWRFALGHGADPAQDFHYGKGQNAFAKNDRWWAQRTVIQVAERKYSDGKPSVDRDEVVEATLKAPQ